MKLNVKNIVSIAFVTIAALAAPGVAMACDGGSPDNTCSDAECHSGSCGQDCDGFSECVHSSSNNDSNNDKGASSNGSDGKDSGGTSADSGDSSGSGSNGDKGASPDAGSDNADDGSSGCSVGGAPVDAPWGILGVGAIGLLRVLRKRSRAQA